MTFSHDEPGTPESAWQSWGRLGELPALDPDLDRLVVVSAHPDDETLGAGGLIATCAARGVPVDVVVATSGEASHPRSPTTASADLAATRSAEVEAAVAALAPAARLHRLGLPDGGLAARADQLRDATVEVVGAADRSCWLVAPWRGDAHPDHEAAGRAAAETAAHSGARLLEYPVWAWHWARPGDSRLPWACARRLALTPAAESRKRAAMRQHRSQTGPLSDQPGDETLLSPQFLAHFDRPDEVFLEITGPASADSLSSDYFDDFYAGGGADPWGFTSRWYERRKRALSLAALPRERFRRAFEPGCSIGVLTEALAGRCDEVLACDPTMAAVEQARARLTEHAHVQVSQASVPGTWPTGAFDLIVVSEVGYYCDRPDLGRLVERAAAALTDDGVLLACHWRHPVADYPLGGDAVHAALRAHPRLAVLASHVEEDFLLDVLVPAPATSVARGTGLVP